MVRRRTKIILIAIILGLITLINVASVGILFFNIFDLKMPETTLTIEVFEITENEAVLHTNLLVKNPNSFDLCIQNITLNITTETGSQVLNLTLVCGTIKSNENRSFAANANFSFTDELSEKFISEISGMFGVQLFGIITKNMPLHMTVVASLGDILKTITMPMIHTDIEFNNITEKGANINMNLEVTNPNPFDLNLEGITASLIMETGDQVGSLQIIDGLIPSKGTAQLTGEGSVQIKALNAQTLTVNISGDIVMNIIGAAKTLPLSVIANIKVPHLEDIFRLDTPTDVIIKSDMKASATGFTDYLTLVIKNPNNIAMEAKDITFSTYIILNDQQKLIGESIIDHAIVTALNTTNLTTEIKLPYSKLLFPKVGSTRKILPDALMVTVRAKVTISGLDEFIWIGVSGYQDLHIVR
jgi:LEA14-like dessication related protein